MRYDFNITGEIISIRREGILLGQWPVEEQADSDIKLIFSEDKIRIELSDNDYLLGVIGSFDTVFIDSSEVAGTMTEKFTEIKGSAFSASESSSGGTATLPILQSPDDTLWLIGVNNAGALQTTQVGEGTPTTLNLFSPDNTEYEVTVSDEGALITTEI